MTCEVEESSEVEEASGTEEASDNGEDDGVIIKTSGRCTNIMSYEECKKYVESKGKKFLGILYCLG